MFAYSPAPLLIALLSLSGVVLGCSECVTLVMFNCQVCYENCEGGLKLKSCIQKNCFETNKGDCIQETRQYEEEDCLMNCCKNVTSSKFNLPDLQKCEQQNNTSLGLALLVTSAPFVFCFFLWLIVACTESCKKCESCGDCFESFCYGFCFIITFGFCCNRCREQRKRRINQQQSNQVQMQPKYDWKKDDLSVALEHQFADRICSVCLDKRVNIMTQCSHFFHDQCIWDWFYKRNTCPNCVRQNVERVRVYCRGCFSCYVELNLGSCVNIKEFQANIKVPNCQLCQQ